MRAFWILLFTVIFALAIAGGWWVYQDSQRITTLDVAAGQRGADSHTLMLEISQVLERHSSNLRLNILEGRDVDDGVTMIENGAAHLATVSANTPAYSNIQLVANLFSDYFLMITRVEPEKPATDDFASLQRVTDLPGHGIIIPEAGSNANYAFWSVVDHYKVPPESFRTYVLPREQAMERFISGGADAIFFMLSLRDPFLLRFIEEAGLRNMKLKFMPIDQARAMRLKRPFMSEATIVKGAFDGRMPLPANDIAVPSVNRMLVAGKDVGVAAINELVRTVFANRLDLLIRMPLSSSISDPRKDETAVLSLHDGAQQYFDRNEPSFLQEHSESMAFVITILAMIGSAVLALRRNLMARAKNRADVYNVELLEIAARARQSEDVSSLRAMRDELGAVMEKVVQALDTDKVTDEGFQSFSTLWGSVRDTVNDRIQDLR